MMRGIVSCFKDFGINRELFCLGKLNNYDDNDDFGKFQYFFSFFRVLGIGY